MSLFQSKSIETKIVGPNLVAAFHRAQPPLVWRFDLERNHSFTIALQGDEGDWELGITSAKGEFYPVVHFAAREDADEALDAIQTILMKKKGSKIWRFLRNLTLIVLGFGILFLGGTYYYAHRLAPSIGSAASSLLAPSAGVLAPVPVAPTAPGPLPSGIPVPADQFLTAPH